MRRLENGNLVGRGKINAERGRKSAEVHGEDFLAARRGVEIFRRGFVTMTCAVCLVIPEILRFGILRTWGAAGRRPCEETPRR